MESPLLQRLALFSRRRYRRIFLVTALLVGVSIYLASRLTFDTDILNLLPRNHQLVKTYRASLEEFGSLDYLLIAVRIPEDAVIDPYESFVQKLADRLQKVQSLERVDYRIGGAEELFKTFLPKSALFLDADAREKLAVKLEDQNLQKRAQELRRLIAMPQSLAMKGLLQLDPLGLSEIYWNRLKGSAAGMKVDWGSEYLLSKDRRMLLILALPAKPPQNVDFSKRLVDEMNEQIAAVKAEWPQLNGSGLRAAPEVLLGGRYVIAVGDESLIRRDVFINVFTSMLGVLLLFLLAFRRIGTLVYAFIPLSCGLILTFGLAALFMPQLSAATSGVAALLIGLGIDFVIVSYARYIEERQRGKSLNEALSRMNGSSGRAVVVGAVTSAATFFAFGVTDFTGLYQMGFLTGTGILVCMVAVLFLLPAMLARSEDRHKQGRRAPRLYLHGFGSARLIRACIEHPRTVLGAGFLVSAAAAIGALGLEFEDSVKAMRPAGNQGVLVREEVAERFGSGFDHMMLVLTGDSSEEVIRLVDRAVKGAEQLVERGVLNGYDAVTSIIPPLASQEEALQWLRTESTGRLDTTRIRGSFATALTAAGLRPEPFAAGLDILQEALSRTEPISLADFDETPATRKLIERYILHRDDVWKSVVFLYPPAKTWRREPPPEAVQLAEELGPHAVLTGANVVSKFLRERVLRDAVTAATLGFVLVTILLWIDFGRLRETLLTLAPLSMGIVLMLGGMAMLNISMNFMNIFVTTMIIGIGVDYGVHMMHRHREMKNATNAERIDGLVETGKAIVLAALSTVVGFGSLSLSHYPGLRSMGLVAILGAVSTGAVAITVLPAYLAMRMKKQS
ncbi:MAG: MMPL family transporter [Thermoanaerobaculia bacterium]